MKVDTTYGERSDRHQAIMLMNEEELHSKFPETESMAFNKDMRAKDLEKKGLKADPRTSIFGDKNGEQHVFNIGDGAGAVLPKAHNINATQSPAREARLAAPSHAVRPSLKVLMRKLQTIESGKAFGQPMQVTVSDEEKDRLYSMVREAQLRDIQPLAVTTGKKKRKVVEVTESD